MYKKGVGEKKPSREDPNRIDESTTKNEMFILGFIVFTSCLYRNDGNYWGTVYAISSKNPNPVVPMESW